MSNWRPKEEICMFFIDTGRAHWVNGTPSFISKSVHTNVLPFIFGLYNGVQEVSAHPVIFLQVLCLRESYKNASYAKFSGLLQVFFYYFNWLYDQWSTQSVCKIKLNQVKHFFTSTMWNFSPSLVFWFQVRKEYGKCLRTHCCSGKSVETSMSSSSKTTTSRTPGRYSTGSQVSLPACTPGRYSTADSQVRPEPTTQALDYRLSLSSLVWSFRFKNVLFELGFLSNGWTFRLWPMPQYVWDPSVSKMITTSL